MNPSSFLLIGLLLACSAPVSDEPSAPPAGSGGSAGQGGFSGQGALSGSGGAAGAPGPGGTAGQGPSGAGGVGDAGQGGNAAQNGGEGGSSGEAGTGGAPSGGNAGAVPCKQDADCPAGPCKVCSPVRFACPRIQCVEGACLEEPPICEGLPCTPMDASAAGDCGFALGWGWDGAGCKLLFGCACEGNECSMLASTEASCLQGRESCVDPSLPCAGRPCGGPCSPCPPGISCSGSPYKCDAQGTCGLPEPVCPSCLADEDCPAPPPVNCSNSQPVSPQAVCEEGSCKVLPYECPPFHVCDDTYFEQAAVSGCNFSFQGFAWYNGACRPLIACLLAMDFDLLYPDWTSCYEPHKECSWVSCQTAEDCPVVDPCPLCPGGGSACPAVACEGGACRYQKSACP